MSLGEFEVIRRYFDRRGADAEQWRAGPNADRGVLLGIGDDAAVIDPGGPVAVTTDMLVEGVHFLPDTPADALGYRALAVNLSDIAAMGAEPRWALLAMSVEQADERWLEAFAAGFFELADRHGVALVGGDLTRGPLTVTVQLMGTARAGFLTRAGGRAGDDVYVTGSLGDAAAGIELLAQRAGGGRMGASAATGDPAERRGASAAARHGAGRTGASAAAEDGAEGMGASAATEHGAAASDTRARAALEARFLRPTPRVAEGQALAGVASAAIDVSDGLLADLGHLCAASGCGAVVEVEHVPLSAALLEVFPRAAAEAHALGGGDDYELCFTAGPADAERVREAVRGAGAEVHRIGRLVEGRGVVCRRDGRDVIAPSRGYTHFR